MSGTEGSAPTGRLFRSLRAEGDAADAAVPALSLDQAVGLRSVSLGEPLVAAAPVAAAPAAAPVAAASAVAVVEPSPAEDVFMPEPEDPAETLGTATTSEAAAQATAQAAGRRGAHAAPGMKSGGIWIVVIGVTVLVAFADAIVFERAGLGWITGLALLAASIYGAFMVRPEDYLVAVIAPPIAFFIATITAGQLTLAPSGDLMLREALMIVSTLGNNAVWIFGSTLVALAIVLVRRWRSRSSVQASS